MSGTWESPAWSTSETGQASPTNWVEGTACVFACQANGNTPAFTVTMNSNHTVSGIFNGSLTPDPCNVTINGTGVLTMLSANFSGIGVTSDSGDPGLLTISNVITGGATAGICLQGITGQTFLNGANTYTGGTYLGYSGASFRAIANFNSSASFGASMSPIYIVYTSTGIGALVVEGTAAVTIPNPVINLATAASAAPTINIVGNPAGVTFSGNWSLSGGTAGAGANGFVPTPTNYAPVSIGSGGATSNLVTISGVISGTNNLTIFGPGTLAVSAANTYSGSTTISNGTLALAGVGSINNSSQIFIAPNGNFDVSVTNYFALSTNTTLSAEGTSGALGDGSASIKGASGGTVSLGSQPISLFFDGNSDQPELLISQGTLSLNGNAFTVNNPYGQMQAGFFLLIEQASGNITSSGSNSVTVTGNGVQAGCTPAIEIIGGNLYLVVKETPSFLNLSSNLSIAYGSTNVTLSGTLSAAGPMFPAIGETVAVTINGNAQTTTVTGNQGNFSINYNPSTIPASASPYTITYSYAGNASLTPATNTITTLIINKLPVILTGSRTYDGTATAAAAILSVANPVGSDIVTVGGGFANLAGANEGVEAITSPGSLTLGGTAAANYTLTGVSGSVTITPATLSITANNDSKIFGQIKTYGAGSTAFTTSPLQNGETVGSVTITASGGTAANAPAGTYNLIPSAATGGTFNPTNYNITYKNGTLTVFPNTNSWIFSTSGKWETASNWSLGAPGLTDYFDTITNAGIKTITIDATTITSFTNTLTVTNLTIGAPGGSLNTLLLSNTGTNVSLHVVDNLTVLPGGAITLSNSFLEVDNASNTAVLTLNGSSLTLSGSTFQADHLILTNGGSLITVSNFVVGSTNGVTNTATITGGSTVTFSNVVFGIGNDGTTTNGTGTGIVTVTNGTLNVSTINLGSTAGGSGTLTIQSNGTVNVASNLTVVGTSLTSTSSVSVAGGSLTATNGLIQIGTAGTGLMSISGGGNVTAQSIKLGSSGPGASGTLTMNDNGSLRITSLLSVNSTTSFDLPGINVVVDGTGSTLNVGDDSPGKMNVSSPNASQTWAGMNIGYNSTGTYLQSGGQTVVNNSVTVGNCVTNGQGAAGLVTLSGGALYVTNSTHTAMLVVRNGTFMLGSGATLVADNLIITNACAQFLNNGGTLVVNPGNIMLAPNLDADGDGISNGAEAAAGTDPLNPSSYFHIIGVTRSGTSASVTWTTAGGKSYFLQSSTNYNVIAGTGFTNVTQIGPVNGSGDKTNTYVDGNAGTNRVRFYRVKLAP